MSLTAHLIVKDLGNLIKYILLLSVNPFYFRASALPNFRAVFFQVNLKKNAVLRYISAVKKSVDNLWN
jgi:hypothetical protein